MLKGVTRSRALLTGTTPIFRPRNASSLSTSTFGSIPKTSKSESYTRLRPILDDLPPSIDWAVAYGSGVIHQANASKTGVQPMTDFLISSPDPIEFHKDNLKINPSHYPFWARVAGEKTVASVQDEYGAGVWYVTMVNMRGIEVKYGIISSSRLQRDLTDWETLYVAGRLHKPVLSLKSSSEIDIAQRTNLNSALSIALLVLPPTGFTEMELWEQIAGISYSGDPRMSVPGAENPDKVKNIVRGPGNLQGFRDLYGDLLAGNDELRFEKETMGQGGAEGERMMRQSDSLEYRTRLLGSLPLGVQHKLVSAILGSNAPTNTSLDSRLAAKVLDHPDFRKLLLDQLRQIIHRPALTQSVKGLVTAGATKSVQYSLAKFRKWLAARGAKN